MGKLFLIGAGPGDIRDMTVRAADAIRASEVLCGYTVYVEQILRQMPECAGKKILTTPMRSEIERCRLALDEAGAGRDTAMICSGDSGIYAMAGPILEMLEEWPGVQAEIIPGITAAISGAAILGAPLMNDFCVISLSDLLTPWDVIENRLRGAAMGDFTAVLYNPMSRRRTGHLRRACDIFLEYRPDCTPCGWVRNIGREGQEKKILTLGELRDEKVDMFTTVFIGNSSMRMAGDYLTAPRGYQVREMKKRILLFGGTTEGRLLAQTLAERGYDVTVSVATEMGAEYLDGICGIRILKGRMDASRMQEHMREGYDLCIDATHPYAVEASRTIREACAAAHLPCRRLVREEQETVSFPEGVVTFAADENEACRMLLSRLHPQDGVLLTTGAKSCAAYTPLRDIGKARLYIRVLALEESVRACREAGYGGEYILTGRGPYSQKQNETVMKNLKIRYLVTKESGREGGFMEKIRAAEVCGAGVIVIRRPKEEGFSMDQILKML